MALNWCCFCVPLRTGALTIAILYLVVNVGVLLGMAGWFFAELAYYMPMEDEYDGQRRAVRFFGIILGALAVVCGTNITMDSLLVHGVRRDKRQFVLPWVVWYGIFTSLVTLTLLGVLIWLLLLYIEAAKDPRDGIGILVAFLITIGCVAALSLPVMWYWYACVVSYYVSLAPRNAYKMESLQEQDGNDALLSYRRAQKDVA